MKPGVYRGMSFTDYLAIKAVNKSNLDWMRFSPLHFYAFSEAPTCIKDEPTEPMKLGTAIHTALLEPAKFKATYAKAPEGIDRRTKAGKEAWEAFKESAGDREVLTAEQWDKCRRIHETVRVHPSAQALMETGESEVVIIWEDPVEGILCKGRIDWLSDVILDIKSTDSARADDFAKKVVSYEWHVQAAWYSDGYKLATGKELPFIFGAIEKDEPFACAFYSVGERTLELGRELYRRRLRRVAQCRAAGEWPGYTTDIKELRLPAWAEKELSNDEPIDF